MKNLDSKRTTVGVVSILTTVIIIAALIVLNIVTGVIFERFPIKIDLTNKKVYKLTAESIDIVKKTNTPIEITVLVPQDTLIDGYNNGNNEGKIVAEIIGSYAKYSDKITIKYIDNQKNPNYLKNRGIEDPTGFIVVQNLDNKRYLSVDDDFFVEGQTSIEKNLTTAILYVLKEDIDTVYLTTNHNENPSELAMLEAVFVDNGYLVKKIDLLTDKLDDEKAKFVIINLPERDLMEVEQAKLDLFLDNDGKYGRHLFVFADTYSGKLPVLNALAEEWGLKLDDQMVLDIKNYISLDSNGTYYGMYNNFGDEEIAKNQISKGKKLVTFIGETRPISILPRPTGINEIKLLAVTLSDSYVKPLDSETIEKTDDDKSGTFPIMAISEKITTVDNLPVKSSFLLSGASIVALSGGTQFANADYFIELIKYTSNSENAINVNIFSKTLADEEMFIGSNNTRLFIIILINALIPLIIITAGLLIWLKRRHL